MHAKRGEKRLLVCAKRRGKSFSFAERGKKKSVLTFWGGEHREIFGVLISGQTIWGAERGETFGVLIWGTRRGRRNIFIFLFVTGHIGIQF